MPITRAAEVSWLHSHSCIRCWATDRVEGDMKGSPDVGGSRWASPDLFNKELFTIVQPRQKNSSALSTFSQKKYLLQRIQKLGGRTLLLSTLSSEYSYGYFSSSDFFHLHVRMHSWHASWALSYNVVSHAECDKELQRETQGLASRPYPFINTTFSRSLIQLWLLLGTRQSCEDGRNITS